MPGQQADILEETSPESASKPSAIKVSVDDIASLTSEKYRTFNVSLQNNNDSWFRVKDIEIEFYEADGKEWNYLAGDDLYSYLKSVGRRNRYRSGLSFPFSRLHEFKVVR